MSKAKFNPIKDIQQLIDRAVNGTGEDLDLSMAPSFVRGMDLTGLHFYSGRDRGIRYGLDRRAAPHAYDGMMQGGVVNVIADAGQSFAYATASAGAKASDSDLTAWL
jgi:hypothetical protein